jgi:ferredoxin-NADP reductase
MATRNLTLRNTVTKSLLNEHWVDFMLGHFSATLSVSRTLARIEAIHTETPDTLTFVVRPNRFFRGFKPGQFIPVRINIYGVVHERYYSLTGEPGAETLAFTVKRQPGGRVSNWMHEELAIGDVIELGAAGGDFVFPEIMPERLLLIAGGSGITPIYSLTRAALRANADADVTVLYYARSAKDFAFADHLQALAGLHRNFHLHFFSEDGSTEGAGRFSADHLRAHAADFATRETYVCGPSGLMGAVAQLWRKHGVEKNLHREVFSLAIDSEAKTAVVPVNFRRSQRTVENNRPTLLETAEAAGLKPASGCRMGICHTCVCTKVSGVVRDRVTGATDATPGSRIRICVSEPLGPVTLDL